MTYRAALFAMLLVACQREAPPVGWWRCQADERMLETCEPNGWEMRGEGDAQHIWCRCLARTTDEHWTIRDNRLAPGTVTVWDIPICTAQPERCEIE